MDLPQLSHEKLVGYQKSINFLALTTQLIKEVPRGNAEIIDQLKHAALSVPLDIAEAGGRAGSMDNEQLMIRITAKAKEMAKAKTKETICKPKLNSTDFSQT